MGTEVVLWSIEGEQLQRVDRESFSTYHQEKDLEAWVEKEPALLGRELTIVARQFDLGSAGYLDLLAVDEDGRLVVIEFKREITVRETVAQILDYASAVRLLTIDALKAASTVVQAALPGISDFEPRLIMVAAKVDERALRIVNYLSDAGKLDIEIVTFNYFKLQSGQEIVARSITVRDERPAAQTQAVKFSLEGLLTKAQSRGIAILTEVLREVGDVGWWEELLPNFGGTVRYWAAVPSGRGKVLFGMNVGGEKLKSPEGALDVWFNPDTVAEYTGRTGDSVREALATFNIAKETPTQTFLRIHVAEDAKKLYTLLTTFMAEAKSINVATPSQ